MPDGADGADAATGRRRRRRGSRYRTLVATVALSLLAGALIGITAVSAPRPPPPDATDAPDAGAPVDARLSDGSVDGAVTLVTVDDDGAVSIVVLAADPLADLGTVLLVPTRLVTEVPGYGTLDLAEAFAFGGPTTVGVTLDNALQLALDETIVVDTDGWSSLAAWAGGIDVGTGAPLVGDAVVDHLAQRGPTTGELDVLPRVQAVFEGLFDAVAVLPERIDDVADGVDGIEVEDPERLRDILAWLAQARARDRTVTLTLPVLPLGAERDDRYRLDDDRAAAVLDERLAPWRTVDGPGGGVTLQVLNGNGRSGVGQQVAAALTPAGYQVRLTGNADRFTYDRTRIVLHDTDAARLGIARDIQDRLGVGDIERSGTPQSVVDVTIVVGADLPAP